MRAALAGYLIFITTHNDGWEEVGGAEKAQRDKRAAAERGSEASEGGLGGWRRAVDKRGGSGAETLSVQDPGHVCSSVRCNRGGGGASDDSRCIQVSSEKFKSTPSELMW